MSDGSVDGIRHGDKVLRHILRDAIKGQPKKGDFGRLSTGTPARYIGGGIGLGVSCQDNCLMARPFTPDDEVKLPYPTDEEVDRCAELLAEMAQ